MKTPILPNASKSRLILPALAIAALVALCPANDRVQQAGEDLPPKPKRATPVPATPVRTTPKPTKATPVPVKTRTFMLRRDAPPANDKGSVPVRMAPSDEPAPSSAKPDQPPPDLYPPRQKPKPGPTPKPKPADAEPIGGSAAEDLPPPKRVRINP